MQGVGVVLGGWGWNRCSSIGVVLGGWGWDGCTVWGTSDLSILKWNKFQETIEIGTVPQFP